MTVRTRRVLPTLALTALVVSLLPAAAQAANCGSFKGRAVKTRGNGAVKVYAKGTTGHDNRRYYACVGKHGKVRALPNQDGGVYKWLDSFATGGNFVAWTLNGGVDPSSMYEEDSVYLMNAKLGRVLVKNQFSWPGGAATAASEQAQVIVTGMVLASDGSLAWQTQYEPNIAGSTPTLGAYAVQRIGASGKQTVLDRFPLVRDPHALRATPDGKTVSWADNDGSKTAPLAGS